MKLIKLLIIFLMVSFIVQNTCPYGLAAKTAFASAHTHDCPLKKSHDGTSEGKDFFDHAQGKVLNAAFVLLAPESYSAMQSDIPNADYIKVISINYTNPFKEPPIKPPAV
jgi:hypothetical protein